MPGWITERRHGEAAACHAAEPVVGDDGRVARQAWWFAVERPAMVLGSAQSPGELDEAAVARSGVDVVRRRSGGGAVLVLPGEMLWLDVVVPAGDRHWEDDVGRAMTWLGRIWVAALTSAGIAGAVVHEGGLCPSTWSRAVCFDGLGTGEVTVDGRKAVGISQRRTRGWARLQSSVHLRWRPELYADLMRAVPSAAALTAPYTLPAAARDTLVAALDEALADQR